MVKFEHLHSHFSHDAIDAGPQKFHSRPTPRIGGLSLFIGLLVSAVSLNVSTDYELNPTDFSYLVIASLPAFLGGIAEDITKRVSVQSRLFLSMGSGLLGVLLSGALLDRVDIPGLDSLMGFFPVAVGFTVFAVSGATNSINIIDGYNGLASGFAVIVLAGLGYVSYEQNDFLLLAASISMIGSLLGFMIWNWPFGKIFLGDGGAYLVGFWISVISVLLLARHPQVTVWFPMALMGYPVFETLFSMYRRKFKKNKHPGHPDALHLHQLVFHRLVRVNVNSRCADKKTLRNSMVAPYVWLSSSVMAFIAINFAYNPGVMGTVCLVGCVFYVLIYRRLIHWKSPSVLRVGSRLS